MGGEGEKERCEKAYFFKFCFFDIQKREREVWELGRYNSKMFFKSGSWKEKCGKA